MLSVPWKEMIMSIATFFLWIIIFYELKIGRFYKEFFKRILASSFKEKNSTVLSKKFLGHSLALIASLLAGVADVIPKSILVDTVNDNLAVSSFYPIIFVLMLYLINALFFTCISKIKTTDDSNSYTTKPSRRTILLLTLIGIAEAAGTITYYIGLKGTSAINATILGNGETIFAIFLAMIFFRERLEKVELFPFALIMIGAILLPTMYDIIENNMNFSHFVYGDLLILISGIFYAVDITISKFVSSKIDSKKFMQIVSISASLLSLIILALFSIYLEFESYHTTSILLEIRWQHLPTIIFTGIFGMGLSSLFFVIALKLIGITRVVLLTSTTTVFGIILSSLYLSEEVIPLNFICVGMVTVGMYCLRRKLGKSE